MAELSEITAKYDALSKRRAFTQHLIARAVCEPGHYDAEVTRRLGSRHPYLSHVVKAPVGALAHGEAGFDTLQPLKQQWADLVRKQTLIGRMAGAVRNVAPASPITIVGTGTTAGFVVEGTPTPVARPTLTDSSMTAAKIGIIVPFTRESLRVSGEQVAILVERDGSRAVSRGEDAALLDGAAAVAGGRPASILFGLSPLGSGSPGDLDEDVRLLLAEVRGGEAVSPYFLTSPAGARYLLTARETNGNRLFPGVTAVGGQIHGIDLLISATAPDDVLTLIDADGLLVVDEGFDAEPSFQASFQFDSEPTPGATANVSLWQTNSVAFRFSRWIGWRLAWADAAAYITLPVGSPA